MLLKNFPRCHYEEPQRRSNLLLPTPGLPRRLGLLLMTDKSSSSIRGSAAAGSARNDG